MGNIAKQRHQAAVRQSFHCFYCELPMWEVSLTLLCSNITSPLPKLGYCSARGTSTTTQQRRFEPDRQYRGRLSALQRHPPQNAQGAIP